jgi:hypothetical protein
MVTVQIGFYVFGHDYPVEKFNVAVKNHHFDRDDFSINGP